MTDSARTPIAIVGVGAVLPGAPNARSFWDNVKTGVYSITDLPADRWDTRLYYDPDPKAPDKTYSKIGAFVRDFAWDPVAWHIPLPPKVADAMDRGQKWAIAATREALADYGYPERPLDGARTAVILGNAMGGDRHYQTALRIFFPEVADELAHAPSFAALPAHVRAGILEETRAGVGRRLPPITEDTMPGELANVVAGRIAAVFDLHGPNFVCDAACASAMAALNAAVQGLDDHAFDAAITGGVDANMSASTYVKFCKIGALSATGTRPFAAGADGFVMGEGAALFLLKRLEDAEKAGDRIYAVIRGVGGASDGRGKGITAPNPAGQRRAIERAWLSAAMAPTTATLIEGHGTSTRVGDVAEMQSLTEAFAAHGKPIGGRVALGSVKSNIGHLKAAAGAAGLLKTAFALRDKLLPPSLGFQQPNPDIDFERSPFQVNTELRPWRADVRRAGVSAFGFGGTNFHVVLEEHVPGRGRTVVVVPPPGGAIKPPPRGVFVAGGATPADLKARLRSARPGWPDARDLRAPLRVAIDHADEADLAAKMAKAESALDGDSAGAWKAVRAQGIYRGAGAPGKVAFLFTGQGSQYVNMLRELRAVEPIVRDTFDEADAIMLPLLGKPLSDIIFAEPERAAAAEEALRQTAVTQPAILTADIALQRLLASRGIVPDMVMGHSLGEYGALVAAGTLPFADALRAVSARGTEMARVSVADNGAMIAVFAPLAEIERTLATIDGYVVVANVNAPSQAVVGGGTAAVARAAAAFEKAGYRVVPLPVSHAFHTAIVAPASAPMRRTLATLALAPPKLPVISNVTGGFYPETVPEIIELLGRQIAEPVQFVKGLETLYAAGARVFVEVGPKKALAGLAEDVFASRPDAVVVATNHPKLGDMVALNQALCALYAAGLGAGEGQEEPMRIENRATRQDEPEAVVITGAGLGLPGGAHVFDDRNVRRILEGAELIDAIPVRLRRAMSDKHVTRLVKSDQPRFEVIDSPADVIKLAARGGALDLAEEFGVPADRVAALDVTTRLAIAAGLEALRDAGIPLVMHYKTTTRGTRLPDRWMLPDALRDETGVIFASAFPGYDAFADNLTRHHTDRGRRERLADLQAIRARLDDRAAPEALAEVDHRVHKLERIIANEPYALDRRFLFRVLSMGHSQFAEYIGARGPNTQINSACASGSLALSLAEDWIRAGRARRVVIVSADDATSDNMLEWVGAGFLASGAAATDDVVEEAAVPFDRRRHGLIIGMGAAAMVVETAEAPRARGLVPIVEVLGTTCANSAFHGSRLDIAHIAQIMESLVAGVERRHGLDRRQIASELAFMSHETYTPARGGSAQAEVDALRKVFGADADRIVVANTKGFTGHAMGAAVEEAVAVKMLETGLVPPVANFREVDPDLGPLNLSKGGAYPVRYALRLGAGFGSQIAMGLTRWVPAPDGTRREPEALGYEYRIADRARFDAWLASLGAGELEVVKRTLRMKEGPSETATVEPAEPVAERAPIPAPIAAAPPVATADVIQARVLDIVAGVTGYPPEMLDVDLDLEADLGVDTVKQAETFAAVREAYSIPREATLKLKDFPTLAHVIRWVKQNTAPAPTPAPIPATPPVATADVIQARVLGIVAGVTGYPPEMLDVDLDLEADLGVDTVKQAETFAAVREAYSIPREATLKLKDFPTLAHVIRWVKQNTAPAPTPTPSLSPGLRHRPIAVLRPPLDLCKPTGIALDGGARVLVVTDAGGVGAALAARLSARGVAPVVVEPAAAERTVVNGRFAGIYWLPALDDEGDPMALAPEAWQAALRDRVKHLHRTARAFYDALGSGTFLVAGTRLGGRHGADDAGATAPLGGAVTGFVKALKRERPEALIKAVDFDGAAAPIIAEQLVAETLSDPGAVEIGRSGDHRFTVALAPAPAAPETHALGPDAVYVVTGAAGSIVSAIVADLCARGGTFYLLDLAPEPDAEDPDLARLGADRDGLKRDLARRLQERGERATPVAVERALAALERAAAAEAARAAIVRSGGTACYRRVDLRDRAAVATIVDEIRARHGRIDVLVHAAGLEISRVVPDKSADEFDLVFGVKADGWYNLVSAIGTMPLGAIVGFGSIAGRFGNAGQTDYAAANDLLVKLASHARRSRPATRSLVIDWTAWADLGMATRGSIPKVMAAAGIDMLPAAAGIPVVGAELRAGTRGELVIAGALGVLGAEWDATGGLDPARVTAHGPMLGRVVGWSVGRGLTVETTLDPTAEPFLFDHQIDGKAVLPGVMGIEAFAEIATLLLPGWRLQAIEDVGFHAPFKFYRGEPRTFTIEAQLEARGAEIIAACRFAGVRTLAGQEPQTTSYFTARVRLAHEAVAQLAGKLPTQTRPSVGSDAVYRIYFHGPAYQVLASAGRNGSAILGRMAALLPPDHMGGEATVTPARLVELCFQTAGVWEIGQTGQLALPEHVDRLVVRGAPPEGVPVFAVVTPRVDGGFDARIMDEGGTVFVSLEGYRTTPLGEVDAALRAPLAAAVV